MVREIKDSEFGWMTAGLCVAFFGILAYGIFGLRAEATPKRTPARHRSVHLERYGKCFLVDTDNDDTVDGLMRYDPGGPHYLFVAEGYRDKVDPSWVKDFTKDMSPSMRWDATKTFQGIEGLDAGIEALSE